MSSVFDFRNYQIKRDDDYIFDKNGNFIGKKKEKKVYLD